MAKKILILGVNGFIGSSLAWKILNKTDWEVTGVDLGDNKIAHCLGMPNFKFHKKNVLTETEWIEGAVKNCDVVLPLVAIATPAMYVSDPLRVYNLDYESNIAIVKLCAN